MDSNSEKQYAERGNTKGLFTVVWIHKNSLLCFEQKKNHLLSSAFYDDFLQIGIVDNGGSSSVINHYVHTFDNIFNYKIERQNHPFCYPSYAYTIYKF